MKTTRKFYYLNSDGSYNRSSILGGAWCRYRYYGGLVDFGTLLYEAWQRAKNERQDWIYEKEAETCILKPLSECTCDPHMVQAAMDAERAIRSNIYWGD